MNIRALRISLGVWVLAIVLLALSQAAMAAFTNNGDGTVTDSVTGLMWDRCVQGKSGPACATSTGSSTMHWSAALTTAVSANSANYKGYNDWRLPNRNELESLVDLSIATNPAINLTAFPATPASNFWSSTTYTPSPTGAWYVDFFVGGTGTFVKTFPYAVRLVRGGQFIDTFDAQRPATVPGAPTIFFAIPGIAQVTVQFVAPASNGGSPITGYTVTSFPAGGVDSNAGSVATSHNITGLTNGTAYTFTVTATNAIGVGPPSAPSPSVTPQASFLPGAPTGVTATAGDAQATVTFIAPVSNGGSPISGYTVISIPAGGVDSNADTTGTSHVITGLTNGTAYTFTVTAGNIYGFSVASAPSNSVTPQQGAQLSVPGAPTIGTATPGNGVATISFTPPASNGGSPITGYTTTCNPGAFNVSGAASPLTVTGLTNGAAYTCSVTATNAIGASAPSASVNVTLSAVTATRLINLSTRGQVQTGDNVMIGGFIIGGASSKTLLIRAVGPNLANFGVPGVLANPMLQLFSGQTVIASNDDWGSAINAAAIQATGLAPANSLESAILVTLAPGPYTAIVSGVGGGTGVGIVEVFEMDNPTIPLINISTRGQVQTGDNVMIGGFIIQGTASQTVLIRAVGPNLANFGVQGVLANPTLQLFSGQTVIASNDDWQSASNAAAIQATGLAPANSLESAILITLAPGAYTAIVSGVGGVTGVGIVEVFAQ